MNITADRLRSEWTKTKFIDKYVHDIMVTIQDRVMDAHRDSRTTITYGAPVNFSVPEMTNEDTSILVYYSIVRDLEKRGFTVSIEMSTSETTFFISWADNKKNGQLSHMIRYIASKRTDSSIKYKKPKTTASSVVQPKQSHLNNINEKVQQYNHHVLVGSSNDISTAFSAISSRSGHGCCTAPTPASSTHPPIPKMFVTPVKKSSTSTSSVPSAPSVAALSTPNKLNYVYDYDDQLI